MADTGRVARPATPELRQALLTAALDEVREVGVDRASMRSIGRRVGISHQGITHHFPNRAALLTAVAVQGWGQLRERIVVALDGLTDDVPGARVVEIGRTYVAFARDDRSRFTLMLSSAVLDADDPDLVASQGAVWSLHLATVEEANRRGWGGPVAPTELAFATFSLAHGVASLEGGMPALVGPGLGDDILLLVNRAIIGS